MKGYRIEFSSENVSIQGRPLDETRRSYANDMRMKMLADGAKPSELDSSFMEKVGLQVHSKYDSEKEILIQLLQSSTKHDKTLEAFNEITDAIGSIKNSNGHVNLSGVDIKRIKKAFSGMDEKPAVLFELKELFNQIENSKEVEV